MTYFLLIIFSVLIYYYLKGLKEKDKRIENHVKYVVENRVRYTVNEYQKNQDQMNQLKFKAWLADNEFDIRREAISDHSTLIQADLRSSINIVKRNFPFNPKDIKFIGRFIDLIVFDGAADEEEVNIYFIDIQFPGIKYNIESKLKVLEAIESGNYTFQELQF